MPLEEINQKLGFEFKEYEDIGDRVIFLKNNRIVFHQDWFPDPESTVEKVAFVSDQKSFTIDKTNASFKIKREGNILLLYHVPNLE